MRRNIKKILNHSYPSKKIENTILKLSILGLLSLVFVQFFLSSDTIRTIIGSNNNSNVIAIEESVIYNPPGWVEIEIQNLSRYKKLSLLKNGKIIEDIPIEKDIINIEVYDGDVIEVVAIDYNEPINIHIHDVSENIENPIKGMEYQSSKDIVYLFNTKIE